MMLYTQNIITVGCLYVWYYYSDNSNAWPRPLTLNHLLLTYQIFSQRLRNLRDTETQFPPRFVFENNKMCTFCQKNVPISESLNLVFFSRNQE